VDPRPAAIARRLAEIGRVVTVTGGKGGIGKSTVAALFALVAAERGLGTGLLDLDVTAPCSHLLLGAETLFPEEDFGVRPTEIHRVRLMTMAFFSGRTAAPLRGAEVSQSISELLAITRWGPLDLLVVDMPPGLGDAALDAARVLGNPESVVVATPSRVVVETVRRTLGLLRRLDTPLLGIIENQARDGASAVRDLAAEAGIPLLASLPYDDGLEVAAGRPARLLATRVADGVRGAFERIVPAVP
jgi:ATP-binding protein involved in chromosome partitioning